MPKCSTLICAWNGSLAMHFCKRSACHIHKRAITSNVGNVTCANCQQSCNTTKDLLLAQMHRGPCDEMWLPPWLCLKHCCSAKVCKLVAAWNLQNGDSSHTNCEGYFNDTRLRESNTQSAIIQQHNGLLPKGYFQSSHPSVAFNKICKKNGLRVWPIKCGSASWQWSSHRTSHTRWVCTQSAPICTSRHGSKMFQTDTGIWLCLLNCTFHQRYI